jgi:voltage-gated potassium channel
MTTEWDCEPAASRGRIAFKNGSQAADSLFFPAVIHGPGSEKVPEPRLTAFRRRLAHIFEDEEPRSAATRCFNTALTVLILANVSCVILESVEPIRVKLAGAFDAFEQIATAIFAVEYVLRVWAAVDFRYAPYHHPIWGRLRYMRSFFALIDLIAVLPAVLGFFDAADFRVLRLLRLLRMFKLVRHSTTFGLLFAALREESRSLGALLVVLLLTVTISASLMYMLEGADQPTVFSSIPAAMWWAIETLTTVGYGDMVPVTAGGRVVGGAVSVIGVGTLALFTGLITVGFLEQLKAHRERHPEPKGAAMPKLVTIAPGSRGDGLVTAPDQIGEEGGGQGVCPHCGAAFSYSMPSADRRH